MKRRRILTAAVVLTFVILTATGCVPGDGKASIQDPAGFFWGVWHGWIAPVSLIIGLFDGRIRVYETINTGWWYDFGFYMAIISGFGGVGLSRKRKKRDDQGCRKTGNN